MGDYTVSILIRDERTDSEQYNLKLIDGTSLVAITRRNVAIVEAMIRNDSAYMHSNDVNAKITHQKANGTPYSRSTRTYWEYRVKQEYPHIKYGGSCAYWCNKLKDYLLNGKQDPVYSYAEIIYYVISAIDRENSTHLNADGVGRFEITRRILGIQPQDLINHLKYPERNNYKLIEEISKQTHPDADHKPRENYPFATKFCHYVSFYLFEGYDEQDNFSIYDNVVEKALLKYTKRYGFGYKASDFKTYATFLKAIEDVINASKNTNGGGDVSRNGFDHLLWYYYKGRV